MPAPPSGNSFGEQVLAVFGAFMADHGFELRSTSDSTWFGSVQWNRDEIAVLVNDDRHERIVEVFVDLPLGGRDAESVSVAMRAGGLHLPLWAIVEADGASSDTIELSGANRIARLDAHLDALRSHAMPLLTSDGGPAVDGIVELVIAVIRRRQWEWSPEGRRANRFLP